MGGRHISFSWIGKYLKQTVQILSVQYFSLDIQLAVGCWSYLLQGKSHFGPLHHYSFERYSLSYDQKILVYHFFDNNLPLHSRHITDQKTLIHHFFEPTILFLIFFFASLSIISYVKKILANNFTAEETVYCTRTNAIKTSPDTKL